MALPTQVNSDTKYSKEKRFSSSMEKESNFGKTVPSMRATGAMAEHMALALSSMRTVISILGYSRETKRTDLVSTLTVQGNSILVTG